MIPAKILVVIVNYRTPALALDAVASLADEVRARGDTHVVVVDNGSGDDSAERIGAGIRERGFGGWCTLVAETRNGGFAAGNNAGLAWYQAQAGGALPEFQWLLNPDTRAHPGALGALVDFLEANPRVGIAGSRCLWENGDVWASAFRFPSIKTELNAAIGFGPLTRLLGDAEVAMAPRDVPMQADWVSGTSMMVRRTAIQAIGPMDEGYFLYFEETDYCARARDAGLECWVVPSSKVTHIGGQSTGVTGRARAANRRPRYWFFSRTRFLVRHYGVAAGNMATIGWLLLRPIGRMLMRLRGLTPEDPPHFWRDFLAAYYGRDGLMYRPTELVSDKPAVPR